MKSASSKSAPPKPALSKKLLRALPTLTEVVATPAPPAALPAPAMSEEDALVERVLRRLEASLEVRIQNAVAAALEEKTKDLGPRIRQRVDYAVRKALTQALADEGGPPAARAD